MRRRLRGRLIDKELAGLLNQQSASRAMRVAEAVEDLLDRPAIGRHAFLIAGSR
jgi:hypothetical protein